MAGEKSAEKLGPQAEETDFVISRLVYAPREMVFKAWSEPKQLGQWWGPRDMTIPVCEMDVRPGGGLHIVMRAPDGTDYPIKGSVREVVAPERLAFIFDLSEHSEAWHDLIDPARDKSKGRPAYNILTTVTFEEAQKGKTLVTVRMSFGSKKVRDDFNRAGNRGGWSASLDCLEEYLVDGQGIVATRVFDAPRDVVFGMWTDPKKIAEWWGPNGFSLTTSEMDVRPGGKWLFVMHGPDGRDYKNEIVYEDYKNEIVYEEVARPERLVYSHFAPNFRSTVTFTELLTEAGAQTEITVRMVFESAALRSKIAEDHKAVEGLQQTLGRLAERLATRSSR